MSRKSTHRFGESQYEPTTLEEFVDELAVEWGIELGDLRPTQSPSYGAHLNKRSEDQQDEISIWYTRNPSEETGEIFRGFADEGDRYLQLATPHLFADNSPGSEFAYLEKGDKYVVIKFGPEESKIVTVIVLEISEAIARASTQASIYNMIPSEAAGVNLQFNGTAHRETRGDRNPEGDAQNAFNFVRSYLS